MSANLKNNYAPLPQVKRGAPLFPGYDPRSGNMLYPCGSVIVIRNVDNPLVSDIYYEHTCQTTAAKYSPSGNYIASGDIQGNVRIWDTTQKEHPLKIELKVLGGAISDIAWSGDSQRIIVVGNGRERYGVVFVWDAGSSIGDIAGHTKPLVSCDFKPSRPFRIATGGEDSQVNWYEGPPFKFKKSLRHHQRMVTCIRFSPDGNVLATCATDKRIALFDAKSGDELKQWEAHKGGVYGLAWAPDSTRLISVSADKTAAIWDAKSGEELARIPFGTANETSQQQLGCLWTTGDRILSVNLEGELAYVDAATHAITSVMSGHNKAITALCRSDDSHTAFTGSYDGRIVRWDISTGKAEPLPGHTNQVNGLAMQGTSLVSCAMDNTVRITPLEDTASATCITLEAPVTGVAVGKRSDLFVAVSIDEVTLVRGGRVVGSLPIKYHGTCVALSPDESMVAVGGKEDKSVHVYAISGTSLTEKGVISQGIRGEVTAVAFSPDGRHLATADAARNVFVWDAATRALKIEGWIFHAARVSALSWTADSKHVASGGLDGAIYVWSLETPEKRIVVKKAHPSGVNALTWLNDTTILSAGQDCAMKSWDISFC